MAPVSPSKPFSSLQAAVMVSLGAAPPNTRPRPASPRPGPARPTTTYQRAPKQRFTRLPVEMKSVMANKARNRELRGPVCSEHETRADTSTHKHPSLTHLASFSSSKFAPCKRACELIGPQILWVVTSFDHMITTRFNQVDINTELD